MAIRKPKIRCQEYVQTYQQLYNNERVESTYLKTKALRLEIFKLQLHSIHEKYT